MVMARPANIRIGTGMFSGKAATRWRHGVTGLADPEFSGKIAPGGGVLVEYRPAVGVQLTAARVVHVTAHEPDVGKAAVSRIDVASVAVGALDVLAVAVVCRFAGMAVCANVDCIGRGTTHVGAQQITLGRRQQAEG